jgi:hypothetical protein
MRDLWVSDQGTYGTNKIVLVDTSVWSKEDWNRFTGAHYLDRMEVAVAIAESKGSDYEYA